MAEPDSKQASRQRANHHKGSPQPISRHPLFPAIVALWFAVLLGMGSFVISTPLLERLIIAGHIDSLIPAAAPPLGTTARLLLALVLGLPAGVLGWVLAKRLAAPKSDAAAQVFNVTEADLGAQLQWPGVAEPPVLAEPLPSPEPAPSLDPSSLDPSGPAAAIATPSIPAPDAGEAVTPPPRPMAAAGVQDVIAASPPCTAAQRILSADLADLSHVELVERLALALQRREELVGTASGAAAEVAGPVLHFPDLADRRNARSGLPAVQAGHAPQETEKALRAALAQLKQLSGTA